MFRQWNRRLLDLRSLRQLPIGVQPVARSESSRTIFCSPYLSYWRTPGTNRKQASLIRRTGLAGKACFENTTIAKAFVGFGGTVASMPIRQNFKSTWREQSRQKISAA